MVAAVRRARSWWLKNPRRAGGVVAALTAFAVILGALNALAATITYDPTAVTETAWTRTGGFTSAGVLADTSDATYMYTTTQNSAMYVAMTDPSGMSGVITNVSVHALAAETGWNTTAVQLGVGEGGTVITGGWAALSATVNGTSMIEYSDSWANDPRGGAWTWADIALLQGVVRKTATGTNTLQVAKMWIEVEYTTDTTPPTLDSASATDSTHVAVVFSEAIDATSVTASDFSIPGLAISGVSVSGSTVTLTTSVQDAIAYTVSCALGNVTDSSGNGNIAGSANFTGMDGIAPTLLSATSADAMHVEVVFSEPIAAGSLVAGDFSVPGLTVSGVSVSGSTVTLTTSVQDAVSYTVSCAAGYVSDAAGNGNIAGSDSFIGTDGVAPMLVSATSTDATHVEVLFSEPIEAGSVADTDFGIAGLTVTGVSVSGSTVTLITTAQDGIGYTVTCTAGRVTDGAGNGNLIGSAAFIGTDGIRPQIVSAASSSETLVDVTFSEELASATVDADGSDFTIPGLTITAAMLDVDGITVHLTTSVQDGVTYTAGCVSDVLTDVAGNGNASGSADFMGTDGIAPWIASAYAVDATHADVVFSEPLQSGSVGPADFAIAGLAVSAAVPDADGVTVHLTTGTQGAGVDYTVSCTAGRVLDVAGNGNIAGSDTFVGFDITPPTMDAASAPNTTRVDVMFSEALRPASIEASDFSIAGLTVSGAVLDADGVTVHLTTSEQSAGAAYAVVCAAGNVLNLSGIGNAAGSAGFTGSGITDSDPPSAPGSVTVVAGGEAPTIASVSWSASTDDVGVAGYRIYRSTTATGPFGPVGTTVTLSFADDTGVPGQEYWYAVEAFDAAGNASIRVVAAGAPVVATWTLEPHDAYTSDTRLCKLCHVPHNATTSDGIFRPTGADAGELGVCYACHDGSGATDNIKTGVANSFTGGSGHALEGADTATDLTNRCSGCHGPHRDYTTAPMLPKQTVNGVAVNGADNSWCLACHDAANSWYTGGTYDLSRDATGYPVTGTFPGPVTYSDPIANPHASIPASATAEREAGDCLYCHSSHRGVSAYDGLVAEFTVPTEADPSSPAYGDYAQACFVCHGAANTYGFDTQPQNIQQYVMAGGERSGHRIETAGGTYAVGTPLPCYECHNPHGSARGNEKLFADALGEGLAVSGASAAEAALNVREFCFTCHTTGDATPMAWDSETDAYVAVDGAAEIVGLERDGGTGGNRLRIPAVAGHYEADTQSCGSCHGSDYGTGGMNVHNPTGGASDGGIACYSCHNYQATMEDLAGAKAGDPLRLDDSAHHVMGGSGVEGDIAPKDSLTGYPTSQNDVYCVSCHTDHNYFNANKGANLRMDLSSTSGVAAANTDFVAANPSGGICLSCHGTVKSKQNMGTEQLDLGAATTPAIDRAAYDTSAHDYTVASAFGTSSFEANCSKCHSDEQNKEYSSAAGYRFGTHWSENVGILGALGASLPALPKHEACLSCHNDTSQPYGAVIAAPASATADEFAMTSSHDLTKVTCVNCHNVHEASAANPAADPDNTYIAASLGDRAGINAYCLKCHDATLPAATINDTTLVPHTVTAGASANVSTHYSTSGHGVPEPGAAFTGRTVTSHAASFSPAPSTGSWTDGSASTGVPDGATAVSPTGNVFDGRHSFILPAPMSTITNATLTVRSRAVGAWGAGGSTGTQVTRLPNSDITDGSWTRNNTDHPNSYEYLDDPVGAADNGTTYLNGGGTNELRLGISAFAVPVSATNIVVDVISADSSAGSNYWVTLNVGGTWDPGAVTYIPTAAWEERTTNFPTQPNGMAWTVAAVNSIAGVGLDTSNTTPRVTQLYVRVTYDIPPTNDDTWAIQYTTDGTTWTDLVSPNFGAEDALTDHSGPVVGLTPANFANFRVRVLGAAVNGADNVGTVEWDSSTLQLTYDGADPGLSKTSCRDCHEQHGSPLVHLVSTQIDGQTVSAYSDIADQQACLACHRSGTSTDAPDIARYYPTSAAGAAQATMDRSGHRIVSGPNAGSAMPCRSCHNPHGSAGSGYMLAVRTQVTAGVDTIIGMSAGELVMSEDTQLPGNSANVRHFCFTCHTTSDTGNQRGWDGSAMVVIPAGAEVLGVDRASAAGVLRLPDVKGHRLADAESCYVCHGDDFTQSTSVNVHNPSAGESSGVVPCYECHSVYRDQMEDTLGAEQGGEERLQSYHHVLGSATSDGDRAFASGSYPAVAGTDVYCLSCHVDHDKFAASRGANLRAGLSSEAAADTDFDPSTNTGVCVDCHLVERAKDEGNQKADATSVTPVVTAAGFGASAHDYTAASTFTGASGTFRANCTKCHDSEIDGGGMERGQSTTGFQTSANKFSVHTSANQRVLAAMNATVPSVVATEEGACYKCHSRTVEGAKTATNNYDWYGAFTTMSANSQSIQSIITGSAYGHFVQDYAGDHLPSPSDETQAHLDANRHVECADCHDPHSARTGTHAQGSSVAGGPLTGAVGVKPSSWPANWTAPAASSYVNERISDDATDYEAYVCFKCHSGYSASRPNPTPSGAYAQTDIAMEFNPNNESGHNVMGDTFTRNITRGAYTWYKSTNLSLAAGWTIDSGMTCSDCHAYDSGGARGPHGSSVPFMLKWGSTTTKWYQVRVNDWNNTALICNRCHTSSPHGSWMPEKSDHYLACGRCHITIPHGWKRPRMLVGQNDPAPYRWTGAGGTFYGVLLHNVNQDIPNKEMCIDSACGGRHEPSAGDVYW